MENRKVCPLKFTGQTGFAYDPYCKKEDCAWWCEWAERCAMVAISAEISNRAHDIVQTMRD